MQSQMFFYCGMNLCCFVTVVFTWAFISLLNLVGLPQAFQLQVMLKHQDAIAFVHLAFHSPLALHTNTLEKMQTFSPNIHTPNHIIY